MTKPYKPSDAIIEQLAREYCENLGPEQEWEDNEFHQAFLAVAMESASRPTIRKALELYENQPQWQEKPDKVGRWCVMVKDDGSGWGWTHTLEDAVVVYKQKGALYLRDYMDEFTLSQFLKQYSDYDGIKFLYIPEPEPYKEGK
ncbi:hypothetical protein KKB3_01724 [Dehalococcoides mccartyi]|nr:hypothetical protein KKB3_01724 [Dehalococcoides mccartyi]